MLMMMTMRPSFAMWSVIAGVAILLCTTTSQAANETTNGTCYSNFVGSALGGTCFTEYRGTCTRTYTPHTDTHTSLTHCTPPGPCEMYTGNNIFIPTNTTLADLERPVSLSISQINAQVGVDPDCIFATERFACFSHLLQCDPAMSVNGEAVPILACSSGCEDFWNACNKPPGRTFDTYAWFLGDSAKSSIEIPMCEHQPSGIASNSALLPWQGDKFGERPLSAFPFYAIGLKDQYMFPVATYTYTLPDGTVKSSLQCQAPPAQSSTHVNLGQVSCSSPLVVVNNTCQVSCPYPVLPESELDGIATAFAIPGLIALVFFVLVLLDSGFLILLASGGSCTKCMKRFVCHHMCTCHRHKDGTGSSSTGTSQVGGAMSSNVRSAQRTVRSQLRSSTMYALLASVMGIIFFFVGPLAALTAKSQVTCPIDPTTALPSVETNFFDIYGDKDYSTMQCKAQRASVFLVQFIFSLILYALIRVQQVVSGNMKSLSSKVLRMYDVALLMWCVGLPVLCLALAYGLDSLDTSILGAHVQIARQAPICMPRLPSSTAEFIIVSLPFIVNGVLVVALAVHVFVQLKSFQAKTAGMVQGQSTSSKALAQLMQRLAILGICTFAVLIVFMVTTSLVTAQIEPYAEAFKDWYSCELQCLCKPCAICADKKRTLAPVEPNFATWSLQMLSLSLFVLLVAGFFAAQTCARLYKDINDGTFKKQIAQLIGREARQVADESSANSAVAASPGSGKNRKAEGTQPSSKPESGVHSGAAGDDGKGQV